MADEGDDTRERTGHSPKPTRRPRVRQTQRPPAPRPAERNTRRPHRAVRPWVVLATRVQCAFTQGLIRSAALAP